MERLLEYDNVKNSPVVVLSHPHGSKLYISCGRHCGDVEGTRDAVLYNAKTCGGCSGGVVINLHKFKSKNIYVHSSYEDGLGKSADWRYSGLS